MFELEAVNNLFVCQEARNIHRSCHFSPTFEFKRVDRPGTLSKKQRINEPANLDCLNLTNLYLPATHVIHDPHQEWSSDPSAYPDRYGPTNELVRKLIEQLGIKYKVPKYTMDRISPPGFWSIRHRDCLGQAIIYFLS